MSSFQSTFRPGQGHNRRGRKRARKVKGNGIYDEDVMMRARKWFNGEEEKTVKSTDKWYDSIVDKKKLIVETPSHHNPDVDNGLNKGEKAITKSKSFGLFNIIFSCR